MLSLCFMNCVLLYGLVEVRVPLKILAILLLVAAFVCYNIKPDTDRSSPRRQRVLVGGCELMTAALVLFPAQAAFYIYIGVTGVVRLSTYTLIVNGVLSAFFVSVLAFNGFIRTILSSKQLSMALRVSPFFLWWVPVVNLVLFGVVCKTARKEYKFLRDKRLLNESRKGAQICKTQHPLLMLHGVFFRDWKYFNYWGRIPKELTDNGARVYYGNHNSSLPVEQSAQEIRQRILDIIQEAGCEKVNIIAHSKGGIDARYAISCLGMDAHVASLTTINTPHKGSVLADTLLNNSPEKLVASIGKKYKALYTKLGDDDCDFFGSVQGLTAEKCAALNAEMPNREGVLYQSVGSAMRSAASAVFPLNAGYTIIKAASGDGDNDGLVCADSMYWGNNLGTLRASGKKGISHGDMIDLTKKNIPDFDVCEYYVQLVSALREKGL